MFFSYNFAVYCPTHSNIVPWDLGTKILFSTTDSHPGGSFFLPSFLPSILPTSFTLLTFFLPFSTLIIPLTTIKTHYVFYPFISFLSLFFHLEYKLHEGREFCLSSPLNPQYLELCLDKILVDGTDEYQAKILPLTYRATGSH